MALTNVPLAGQNLAETREPIRKNFEDINTGFAVNHIELNSGVDSGKHKFVTLPAQNPDVHPATGVNEFALYAKTVGAAAQMFLRFPNNAAIPFDFTSRVAAEPSGFLRLPNGIMMKWGRATANGSQAVLYPVGGGVPAFSVTPFFVQLTPAIFPPNGPSLAPKMILYVPNGSTPLQFNVVASNGAGAAAQVEFIFLAFGFSA